VSLRINTNVQALNALRNLTNTVGELGISMTRLSTGLRINSAADDPAGLVISEGMRSQLKGIDQAIRNSQDAVNMAKTAEGAMDEVQTLLRNMRALAVHSANTAVVDSAMLQANQNQIRSTIQSINRISEQTSWGNKRLLDGTAGVQAGVTDTTNVASVYMGSTFGTQSIAGGTLTLQRTTAATQASMTLSDSYVATTTVVTPGGSFVINGSTISVNGTSDTLATVVAKINAQAANTGVAASITGAGPYAIQLNQQNFGADFSISLLDPVGVLHNVAAPAPVTGIDAVFNVTAMTGSPAAATTSVFTGGIGSVTSGLRLTDSNNNVIVLNPSANTAAGFAAGAAVGQISVGSVRFQIGANENQGVTFSMPNTRANQLGTAALAGQSIASLDVTSSAGSQNAISIIDSAIEQLAAQRGEIGSFQTNFLDSTVRSLSVARENLTASESQVRDADVAEEMSKFTRLQILQQSGMSMLAQANQAPQQVLALLKGN